MFNINGCTVIIQSTGEVTMATAHGIIAIASGSDTDSRKVDTRQEPRFKSPPTINRVHITYPDERTEKRKLEKKSPSFMRPLKKARLDPTQRTLSFDAPSVRLSYVKVKASAEPRGGKTQGNTDTDSRQVDYDSDFESPEPPPPPRPAARRTISQPPPRHAAASRSSVQQRPHVA